MKHDALTNETLTHTWQASIEMLDFAFQPIVHAHTGSLFGVEALLRNVEAAGFDSIDAFFNQAYDEGVLHPVDILLRRKAIEKFITIPFYKEIKLFYNLDNRTLLASSHYQPGRTEACIIDYDMSPQNLFFEISEKTHVKDFDQIKELFDNYKNEGFSIAIDDFGTGFSGFQLLYHSEPSIIKIDRFFVSDIDNDDRKKLYVTHMGNLATKLGVTTLAEGIERPQEYYLCKEIGCQLMQGYLIQRPTLNIHEIQRSYDIIKELCEHDRRSKSPKNHIRSYIQDFKTVNVNDSMMNVLEMFKENPSHTFLTVVDEYNFPIGVVQEKALKKYVYSQYGRALLMNQTSGRQLRDFISPCPVADINTKLDTILEIFSSGTKSKGIIITDEMKYMGFLSAQSMLYIINERNVLSARDQSPLTQLPGNNRINEYIATALESDNEFVVVYFDFNNFKPFNDTYGFRQGDRAIQLFANLMRKNLDRHYFVGHIGGDDFVFCVDTSEISFEMAYQKVTFLLQRFKADILDLYSKEDKDRGFILAKGRDGILQKFDLLTISAAILVLHKSHRPYTQDDITQVLAAQKKVAKRSSNLISVASMC